MSARTLLANVTIGIEPDQANSGTTSTSTAAARTVAIWTRPHMKILPRGALDNIDMDR